MRRYYPGITIFKFVGALLVLLDHGWLYIGIVAMPDQQLRFIINILSFVVPCFYIIAGFLAHKGWSHAENPRNYVKRYLKWILILYGFFCLLFIFENTIPEIIHKGFTFNNLFFQAKILFMTIILNGPYLQFWFIPPLIFGIGAAFWFNQKDLLHLGVILALLGFLLSQFTSGTLRGSFEEITDNLTFLNPRYVEYLAMFIRGYFGNGFTFVLVGVVLANYEEKFLQIKIKNLLIFAIFVSCFETFFLLRFAKWSTEYTMAFSILPNTLLLFYGVLNIKSQTVQFYHKALNFFSIVTYFTHILFIKMNLFFLNWSTSHMGNGQFFICLLLTIMECSGLSYLLTLRKKHDKAKNQSYLSS